MAIEQKSKSEVMAALRRARSTIQNAKKETRQIAGRTVNAGLTAGAGYGVGMVRKKFGEGAKKQVFIPGTEVEADLAIGVGLTLAGISGVADDYSDSMTALGAGTLAGYLAIQALEG